jgi:hypothetical protein
MTTDICLQPHVEGGVWEQVQKAEMGALENLSKLQQ